MKILNYGLYLVFALAMLTASTVHAQISDEFVKSDIAENFEPYVLETGFTKRTVMIPMRDGVKLNTIMLIPNGATNAPMILTRTPYNAERFIDAYHFNERLAGEGYIRVYQDTRGKYGSEGDYVLTMPSRGPLNSSGVDHTTDAWDTIDWLVKNVAETNGRVGMIGGSYNGFTSAAALLEPHPALKAVVPEGPIMDGWMGDDWFHHGAFRNMMLGFIQMQMGQKGAGDANDRDAFDDYENFLRAGSTADYVRKYRLDQFPALQRTMAHPAYDEYWQGMALNVQIAEKPSTVPTLWVQGLWDQEDTYGANATWRALNEAGHTENNWLIMGPWSHVIRFNNDKHGPFRWKSYPSEEYLQNMLLPFMAEHLKNGPPANLARVTIYDSGQKKWERFSDWPTACQDGCRTAMTPIYLQEDFGLSFAPPQGDGNDVYVSDPAKPVPFLARPIADPFKGFPSERYMRWSEYLVADQRFVDGRPDVLTYQTEVLTDEVHVEGIPVVDLRAMTSGTDGDFVVKLIDVFPERYPQEAALGGYQVPIAMDIFRGRYRESFESPAPIPANEPQQYGFDLPNVNHVFKPGHRIMIQIQSTMFPLYDRNPQTYVPNIFFAKPEDYRKAEITVFRSKARPSAVLLPVVKPAN